MSALALRTTTYPDFASTIVKLAQPARFEDLIAWEASQSPRPYKRLAFAMELYGIGEPGLSLDKIKRRLAGQISREKMKAEAKHYTFCRVRLEAYAAMKSVIEQFEARNA